MQTDNLISQDKTIYHQIEVYFAQVGDLLTRSVQWIREPNEGHRIIGALFIGAVLTATIIGLVIVIPVAYEWYRQATDAKIANSVDEIAKEQLNPGYGVEIENEIEERIYTEEEKEERQNILTELNEGAHRFKALTMEELNTFIDRGGKINIISENPEEKINVSRYENIVTGCSAGENRSQSARGFFSLNGIEVKDVLAGAQSALNPDNEFPFIAGFIGIVKDVAIQMNGKSINHKEINDDIEFKSIFKIEKVEQLGFEGLGNQYDDRDRWNEFYKDYINNLPPTHFVVFGASGQVLIKRLLSSAHESFEDFTISFFNWGDQIQHPPENSGIYPQSREAYQLYLDKLQQHIVIVD